jgi:hypothetical protein
MCPTYADMLHLCFVDPRNNKIRYVGKAQDPAHRLNVHLYAAKTGKSQDNRSHKYNWIRELLREDLAPELVVLESGLNDSIASERERYWIADLRQAGHRLTNHTDGGEGMLGAIFSPETRAKIGAALRGRPLPKTEEWQSKITAALTGRKQGPKELAAHYAFRHTEETKQKLAVLKRGVKQSPELVEKRVSPLRGQKRPKTPEWQAKITAGLIASTKRKGKGGRKPLSPETRAKISAARRRYHLPDSDSQLSLF